MRQRPPTWKLGKSNEIRLIFDATYPSDWCRVLLVSISDIELLEIWIGSNMYSHIAVNCNLGLVLISSPQH